jgi:hypothetical protein
VLELIGHQKLGQSLPFEDDTIGQVSNYDPDYLIKQSFNYYAGNSQELGWKKPDLTDIERGVQTVLDSVYSPLKVPLLCVEKFFDIELDRDWANYSFNYQGEKVEGKLRLRGTIDNIVRYDDNTLEILDWKTGKRLNWATGKEKTQESLLDDQQLRLYHYVAHLLYPEYENISVTIFYINDGGPFSLCFSKDDLAETEADIRRFFEEATLNTSPAPVNGLPCKFCDFAKEEWEDTNLTKCQFLQNELYQIGMQGCIDKHGDRSRLWAYSGGGKTTNTEKGA